MNNSRVHWLIFVVILLGLMAVMTGFYSALRSEENMAISIEKRTKLPMDNNLSQ